MKVNNGTSKPSELDSDDEFDRFMSLDAEAAVQVEGIEIQANDVPRFKRMTWADVMALPPKEWMIDQILGRGDLIMVYGTPGSGKTFATVDMAVSACLGKSWAGRFEVDRPLTVAYAIGEGGSGFAQRLQNVI
jgi:RecA-family ATPase